MIQTLVNKERFVLGITETRLGCHLMQIKSHTMKDCIQGVTETLGIQMKMRSWFIWQEVAILLKRENGILSKKLIDHECVCMFLVAHPHHLVAIMCSKGHP